MEELPQMEWINFSLEDTVVMNLERVLNKKDGLFV